MQKKIEMIKEVVDRRNVIPKVSDVEISHQLLSPIILYKEERKGSKELGSNSGVKSIEPVAAAKIDQSSVKPKWKNIEYNDF